MTWRFAPRQTVHAGLPQNPSESLWSETVDSVGSGADFNIDIKAPLYLLDKTATVSTVNKTFPYRGPCVIHLLAKRSYEMVVYSGTAYKTPENESVTVDGDITLFTFLLTSKPLQLMRLPHLTLCASSAITDSVGFCLRLRLILMTSFSMQCCILPESLHHRKCQYTASHLGKACGSILHRQPLTKRYRITSNIERKEYLRCRQSFSKNTLFI